MKASMDSSGELVNMIPRIDGSIHVIEPDKNAVIVQIIKRWNEDGEPYYQKIVSIEYMDENIYPELKKEALRILRQ